ncbi:MAG: hypothetical protein ABII00_11045 [Elusimicrobiota bacterium]
MAAQVDEHGRPVTLAFNASRRAERTIDELLGLCKGILADGVVNEKEAEALRSWMTANPETATIWPANVLADRLERIFADGRVDDDELTELRDLLTSITGQERDEPVAEHKATRLPVDDPAPPVEFPGRLFCLTGQFVYGSRKACEDAIVKRDGQCQGNPTSETNYLVIGTLCSHDWARSVYGRKIEKVVRGRQNEEYTAAIVSEEHWTRHLSRAPEPADPPPPANP